MAPAGEPELARDRPRIIQPWMRWVGVIPVVCVAAILVTIVVAFLLNEDPMIPGIPGAT